MELLPDRGVASSKEGDRTSLPGGGHAMSGTRLSALDASFLSVESPTAHMHVGWAATFKPPPDGPAPTFAELRDHIGSRLCRGARFRQKIASVPLGLGAPIWVDDEQFELANHVLPARASSFSEI